MADARGNCDAVPMGMGACTDMDPGASGIIWHETKTQLAEQSRVYRSYMRVLTDCLKGIDHMTITWLKKKNKDCST